MLPGTSGCSTTRASKLRRAVRARPSPHLGADRAIPEHVQQAFVAAEDKRFYQHKGIDERGMIRAFISNLANPGRPQGGSTITQQVAKNLLVGDDVTYERKMREMIVASRIEQTLSKAEILEIYLNSIYLGRCSWGIEMAARSYFKKPARTLTRPRARCSRPGQRTELLRSRPLPGARAGALRLRAQPDAGGRRARRRAVRPGARQCRASCPSSAPRRESGFHLVDHLLREARTAGRHAIADGGVLHGALHDQRQLQRATESALQEGLARYETATGRARVRRRRDQSRPKP